MLKNTPLNRFRAIALLEGLSFVLLLFIAMPLKYLAGMPLGVKVVGWAHGMLFVLYFLLWPRCIAGRSCASWARSSRRWCPSERSCSMRGCAVRSRPPRRPPRAEAQMAKSPRNTWAMRTSACTWSPSTTPRSSNSARGTSTVTVSPEGSFSSTFT